MDNVLFCRHYKCQAMLKNFRLFSAVFVLLSAAVISSCKNSGSTAGTVLKFNLEKGKRYSYDITWDTDQKIMDRNDRFSFLNSFSFEVISDDGNVKTLKGLYRKFRLYMKIMDLEMDIDTDKPLSATTGNESMEETMHRVFSKIKGSTFTLKVDENGNVLSVSGFDDIVNGIIESAGLNDEMKLQMRASLKDQFSDERLKSQLAIVFLIFPDKPVNQGDSWQRSYELTGNIPAQFSTTYTIKQIEDEQVTLEAKSLIGPTREGADITGTQSGTLIVNSITGLVVRADFTQQMETDVNDVQLTIKGSGKVSGSEEN